MVFRVPARKVKSRSSKEGDANKKARPVGASPTAPAAVSMSDTEVQASGEHEGTSSPTFSQREEEGSAEELPQSPPEQQPPEQ